MQPVVANAAGISENSASVKEQTVQQVLQVQSDLLSLSAAALLCRRRGRVLANSPPRPRGVDRLPGTLPGTPLCRPGGGWLSLGTNVTIAAAISTAWRRLSLRGGLVLRQYLSGSGIAIPPAPL